MRLLYWNSDRVLSVTRDLRDDEVPPYAILSHTWGPHGHEVTLGDVREGLADTKIAYQKLRFCAEQARKDNIGYFWVDTCCIDRANNTELNEAITSMYKWYRNSQKCYVYLSDVSTATMGSNHSFWSVLDLDFCKSRWFTRGWTLQELIAPKVVEFYSRDGDFLGTKVTLEEYIHNVTTIPVSALHGVPLSHFSVPERLRWTKDRQTSKKEDEAYCLLGIFDVFMPLLYGEGENAFRRLRKEIDDRSAAQAYTLSSRNDFPRSLGLCLKSAPVLGADKFIGRSAEIAAIHSIFHSNKTASEQERVVLGGMGGVGKTQLAIAYARRHQAAYPSTLWFNATSENTMFASVRLACQPIMSSEGLAKLDDREALARLHDWLCGIDNTRWLLIFDNYDEPASFSIDQFCPNTGYGSIIITTRLPEQVVGRKLKIRHLIEVSEGLAILQERSERRDRRQVPDLQRLARRLDGFPLALASTGSFLRKSNLSAGQYLEAYEQQFNAVRRRPTQLRLRTLYTAFGLTFTRLQKENELAANVLQLLGFFNNQKIWYELLRCGLPGESSDWIQQAFEDPLTFHSIMATLTEYCLVESHASENVYSLHNCVHDWTIAELNESSGEVYHNYALKCIANSIKVIPSTEHLFPCHGPLLRHAWHLAESRYTVTPATAPLEYYERLRCLVDLMTGQSRMEIVGKLYHQIFTGFNALFGPKHPETLWAMLSLGSHYLNVRKYREAEDMLNQAVEINRSALQPNQKLHLSLFAALSRMYRKQGNPTDAVHVQRLLFHQCERVHGQDHENTLRAMFELAYRCSEADEHIEAERLHTQAMTKLRSTFESRESLFLDEIHNSYVIYWAQQKHRRALDVLHQSLTFEEKILGPLHYRTVRTIYRIGVCYHSSDEMEKSESALKRALAAHEVLDDPRYFEALNVIEDLGIVFEQQNKWSEAEDIYTKAMKMEHHHRDSDVPTSVYYRICCCLGNIYESQGRSIEARQQYVKALSGLEREIEDEGVVSRSFRSSRRTVDKLLNVYDYFKMSSKARELESRLLALQRQKESQTHEDQLIKQLEESIVLPLHSHSTFEATGKVITPSNNTDNDEAGKLSNESEDQAPRAEILSEDVNHVALSTNMPFTTLAPSRTIIKRKPVSSVTKLNQSSAGT